MRVILWAIVALGAIGGGFGLLVAFLADSAPKQAAAAAMGAAMAVIPYCFARAISEMLCDRDKVVAELRAANEAAATQTRLLAAVANALNPVESARQAGRE